jgi:hypothetical protein
VGLATLLIFIASLRISVPAGLVRGTLAAVVVLLCFRCHDLYRDGTAAGDFHAFHDAGRDALAGRNPYRLKILPPDLSFNTALNPPSALPIFAVFGAMPPAVGYAAFTTANVMLVMALGWLVPKAVGDQVPERCRLPLTLAIVGSYSCFTTLSSGQVYILVSAAIAAALVARRSERHWLAGSLLSLATIKPNTLLPFLVLFHKKTDLKTWAMLTLATSTLVFSLTSPPELPGRLRAMIGRISDCGAVGALNDPSFANPHSATILGVDRMATCMGVDRSAAKGLQFVVLAALGSVLVYGVSRGTIGEDAAVGLTSIYAVLFLYHRNGDAILLALPLGWAVARFLEAGPSVGDRWRAALAIGCLLFVMYVPGTPLVKLSVEYGPARSPWGSLVRLLILPAPTAALLVAFAALLPRKGDIPRLGGRPGNRDNAN